MSERTHVPKRTIAIIFEKKNLYFSLAKLKERKTGMVKFYNLYLSQMSKGTRCGHSCHFQKGLHTGLG